jgi:hypothetical protein
MTEKRSSGEPPGGFGERWGHDLSELKRPGLCPSAKGDELYDCGLGESQRIGGRCKDGHVAWLSGRV